MISNLQTIDNSTKNNQILINNLCKSELTEATVCSYLQMFFKKGVLEISKYSQENTCVETSFS